MKVFESALPQDLKTIAVLMVLFRNTTTGLIFPSVARVAYLLGQSKRRTQQLLGRLRKLRVLIPQQHLRGGRGRTVRYAYDGAALPEGSPFKRRSTDHPFDREKGDPPITLSAAERVIPAVRKGEIHGTERVKSTVRKGDPQITRSYLDRSVERSVERDRSEAERAPQACADAGASAPAGTYSEDLDPPLRGFENDADEDENPEDENPEDPPEDDDRKAAEMKKPDEQRPAPTDRLRDPGRPLSDDEQLRRRRTEWREKSDAAPINLTNLRADAERIAAEIRRRKTGSDEER